MWARGVYNSSPLSVRDRVAVLITRVSTRLNIMVTKKMVLTLAKKGLTTLLRRAHRLRSGSEDGTAVCPRNFYSKILVLTRQPGVSALFDTMNFTICSYLTVLRSLLSRNPRFFITT